MMFAAYGKIKKFLDKVYDERELSPLSGDSLLEEISSGEWQEENISALVLLAADYAAVGSKSIKLRDTIEQVDGLPVLLIAETEALLTDKKPQNPNVKIVIEKSKKGSKLRDLIDNFLLNLEKTATTVEERIERGEKKNEEDSIEKENPEPKLENLETAEKPESEIFTEKETTDETLQEKPKEDRESFSVSKETTVKNEQHKLGAESLYTFQVNKQLNYARLDLERPCDILTHLISKWKLSDGV